MYIFVQTVDLFKSRTCTFML